MKVFAALAFAMIAALSQANADTTTVPSGKAACFMIIQGSYADQNWFSCDGEKTKSLTLSPAATTARISAAVAAFVRAGYRIINCQYAVGEGMSPQYTCTFAAP